MTPQRKTYTAKQPLQLSTFMTSQLMAISTNTQCNYTRRHCSSHYNFRLFQQQNGFAETAFVTKDTLDFVKKGRCGNSDVEFSAADDEDEEARCYSLYTDVSLGGGWVWVGGEEARCYSLYNYKDVSRVGVGSSWEKFSD